MPKSTKKPAKKAAPTYTELLKLLDNLVSNVVEDIPKESRTKHLDEAVQEALDVTCNALGLSAKPKPKPTVYINLTGGCVHEIRATPGFEDALFVFVGDCNDCDPDNLVPVTQDKETFIYSTRAVEEDAPLTDTQAKALHKAVMKYNHV